MNQRTEQRIAMTDEELAVYLGIAKAKECGRIMAGITPEQRDMYERMAWVEEEVRAGRIPQGVIVCREH